MVDCGLWMVEGDYFVDSKEESGLGELGLVVAVLAIADGTDGEDDLGVWTAAAEQVDGAAQVVGTLIDGKLLLLEEGGRALLAVVDDFACFLQAIDVVGAEGNEGDTREPSPLILRLEGKPAFHSVQY